MVGLLLFIELEQDFEESPCLGNSLQVLSNDMKKSTNPFVDSDVAFTKVNYNS